MVQELTAESFLLLKNLRPSRTESVNNISYLTERARELDSMKANSDTSRLTDAPRRAGRECTKRHVRAE